MSEDNIIRGVFDNSPIMRDIRFQQALNGFCGDPTAEIRQNDHLIAIASLATTAQSLEAMIAEATDVEFDYLTNAILDITDELVGVMRENFKGRKIKNFENNSGQI